MIAGRRRRTKPDEAGAALELALVFLTAVALIVTALLTFATTSSNATSIIRATRGTDYDADSAMQAAIATLRVDTTQGYVGACWNTVGYLVPTAMLNTPSQLLRVDCSPFSASASQRHVVLSVCLRSIAAPCPDNQALLRADITFYDDQSYGRALSIQSWSNQ